MRGFVKCSRLREGSENHYVSADHLPIDVYMNMENIAERH